MALFSVCFFDMNFRIFKNTYEMNVNLLLVPFEWPKICMYNYEWMFLSAIIKLVSPKCRNFGIAKVYRVHCISGMWIFYSSSGERWSMILLRNNLKLYTPDIWLNFSIYVYLPLISFERRKPVHRQGQCETNQTLSWTPKDPFT